MTSSYFAGVRGQITSRTRESAKFGNGCKERGLRVRLLTSPLTPEGSAKWGKRFQCQSGAEKSIIPPGARLRRGRRCRRSQVSPTDIVPDDQCRV